MDNLTKSSDDTDQPLFKNYVNRAMFYQIGFVSSFIDDDKIESALMNRLQVIDFTGLLIYNHFVENKQKQHVIQNFQYG